MQLLTNIFSGSNKKKKPACGFLFCYNEEQIIKETIEHYLKQGIDLVIVDNHSTDSSMQIVRSFRNIMYPGKIIDIMHVKTDRYEWMKILKTACRYMHKNLSDYMWILLIDADSFYCSPVKDMSLLEFMEASHKKGYNMIKGILLNFYPTEKDNPKMKLPPEQSSGVSN